MKMVRNQIQVMRKPRGQSRGQSMAASSPKGRTSDKLRKKKQNVIKDFRKKL